MITGTTSLLSVTRVTTVSVKVLFVIVSVTRPGPVGAGGSSITESGFLTVTVTAWTGSQAFWVLVLFFRKWAGIIAWNSSLVIGFGSTCSSPDEDDGVGDAFLWLVSEGPPFWVTLGGCLPTDSVLLVCELRRLGAGWGGSAFGVLSMPLVLGAGKGSVIFGAGGGSSST